MAPKAAAKVPATPGKGKLAAASKSAPAGPQSTKDLRKAASEPRATAGTDDDAPAASLAAPTNKDEVLAQVILDSGLPHCPNEQIIEILKEKYETLVAVFIHYCKTSECVTLDQATRLKLGTLRHHLHPTSC